VCPVDVVTAGRPLLNSDTSDGTQCPSSAPFSCTAGFNSIPSVTTACSLRSASSPLYFLLRGLTPATCRSTGTDTPSVLFADGILARCNWLQATQLYKEHVLLPSSRATPSFHHLSSPPDSYSYPKFVATGCKQLSCTKNTYCSLPAEPLPHFTFSPVHLTTVAIQ